MKTEIFENKLELGRAAADKATEIIKRSISERGTSYLIAATGASQFEFLDVLVAKPIDWSKVVFFHLDEYVGLPANHPASFRCYLKERIINRVRPQAFHLIHGEAADPQAECRRLGQLIAEVIIDAAFVGIGENGHLAFNDPPADFLTEEPYIVVDLDEACRRQQVGEGWFKTIEEVPRQAISMSIRQIMKAQKVLCMVPDQRKAEAVKRTLESEVSPLRPASILQSHPNAYLYLDRESASLLS